MRNSLEKSLAAKAAHVIRGFFIRGFDYLRLLNFVQNSLSADFSLGYLQILPFLIRVITLY
jgi:hypothetical protein